MHDDEVLAAGFANETWIATVATDVLADLLPHRVEHLGAAGKVDAGELRRIEQLIADLASIAGNEVDDPRRQAGSLEDLECVIPAEHGARGGLPDHRVSHQRGCGREVPSNRREI